MTITIRLIKVGCEMLKELQGNDQRYIKGLVKMVKIEMVKGYDV